MAIRTHPATHTSDAIRLRVAAACVALVCSHAADAQPAALDARIVWVREERVYIASSDSLKLGPGARLNFVVRGKSVATGEVTRLIDGEMVVARLLSGALPREKDLKRVRILMEPASGPRVLRVGYPSAARTTLFFACERMTLAPLPFGSYRVETGGHDFRLIREPGSRSDVPWPETLSVRLFDEEADEEIALERGDLDVAVFWPGELSAHMRGQPRWQDRLRSPRPRGYVAALWSPAPGADSTAAGGHDDSLLTSLNRELFRGDLGERWHGTEPAYGPPSGASTPRRVRYEVDPTVPGRPVLERFLDRAQGSRPVTDGRPVVRLVYVDSPIAAAAVLDYRVLRVDPVFAFDCPVLFEPRLGSYLRDLGVSRLVALFDCVPQGRRP